MVPDLNDPTPRGRCIALFPGAFRPPHKAHFAAVKYLAAQPEIDEVVVIITNRIRGIPGTGKALDTDVARQIWEIFLRNLPNVRVEIAPKSAVKHAFGYFERVDKEDRLLFCVGESDFEQGDGRFSRLTDMTDRTGIAAKVIAAPTGTLPGRATQIRANLARGAAGRAAFMATLPDHLTPDERENVWKICRQGMKEMSDITREKVRVLFVENGFAEIGEISVAKPGKRDEVFRVCLEDGKHLFVKYAMDTVKSASLDQPGTAKPRARLAVERRAIKWLTANLPAEIELPDVIHFNKERRTLMLSEVCPGGKSLRDDLETGVFDPAVSKAASRFLARCHLSKGKIAPLWGDEAADKRHWKMMLALRTVGFKTTPFSEAVNRDLATLQRGSDAASENRFLHLDFVPKNIRIGAQNIGVIDLELSAGFGDPAYDLGVFLGRYILWGISTNSTHSCRKAIQEALNVYRQTIGNDWRDMQSRVAAFAGASIFHRIANDGGKQIPGCVNQCAETAKTLLSKGVNGVENIEQLLSDAVTGR